MSSSYQELRPYLKPYRHWAALAPLLMVVEVILDLMQPRFIQQVVDRGIAHKDFAFVVHTGQMMLVCALFGILGGIGCTVFATLTAQGFGADLRQRLFDKVQSLSFANLDAWESGSLITRLTNDVAQVQEVVMILLRIMIRAPMLLVGSVIMAILTSPFLALLFLPLVPFVLGVMIWVLRRTYPLFGTVQRRLDTLNTVLHENLAGVRVVKAFARAHHEADRFGAVSGDLMQGNTLVTRWGGVTMPLMMLALNAGVVATLWFGGQRVVSGNLQVGQIVAFLNYLTHTLFSLMMVSMLVVRLSRAEASGQRLAEVLQSQPLVRPAASPQKPASLHGRIAFENVTFRYHPDDPDPVLKDISFVAEPGQTIAILGATGAGKTSLVHLIPRFYDVTEGRITLDGIDVRDMDEEALRSAIGIVLQETLLFSGTIRDNIRYGDPTAFEAEVVRAAQKAQADEFIRHFPEGYDTLLGQRGVNLSGGQKQRLAIARALLLEPPILILDDSTSAVDVRTEANIQQALALQKGTQTRIIVAQRIRAVMEADKILVLEEGHLVAQGTHPQLLQSSPLYREIYESQQDREEVAA